MRLHIGEELAHKFCQQVDSVNNEDWINNSEMEILSTFLWHMAQMSQTVDLKIMDSQALKNRLRLEWPKTPGICIGILGTIAIVRSGADLSSYVPKIESNKISKMISQWMIRELKDRHPYVFALTVKGLRATNDLEPLRALWKPSKNIPSAKFRLRLLRESLKIAVTERSKELLEETCTFLENFTVAHNYNLLSNKTE